MAEPMKADLPFPHFGVGIDLIEQVGFQGDLYRSRGHGERLQQDPDAAPNLNAAPGPWDDQDPAVEDGVGHHE